MSASRTPVNLLLDWFVNPNHAPILVADWIGAFDKRGLRVNLITSDDPAQPPHRLVAGDGDIAINYQPEIYFLREEGLPLVRVGGLIGQPLATLATLSESGITSLPDLKGKKVGCAVTGVDGAIMEAMLKGEGLSLKDIDLVNVGFDLVGALIEGSIDAAIGGYRTFEAAELKAQGKEPVLFAVEDHSVPPYEELIFVARSDRAKESWIAEFLAAIKDGVAQLEKEPEACWDMFIKAYPNLHNAINRMAWDATLPLFSRDPLAGNSAHYAGYGQFLVENGLLKAPITPEELGL